jgi:hypothetical protein
MKKFPGFFSEVRRPDIIHVQEKPYIIKLMKWRTVSPSRVLFLIFQVLKW